MTDCQTRSGHHPGWTTPLGRSQFFHSGTKVTKAADNFDGYFFYLFDK